MRSAVFGLFFLTSSLSFGSEIERGIELFKKRKFDKSFEILIPFAKNGDKKAQFYVGLLYDMGSIKMMDKARAVEWYRKSAEQGYAPAEYDMGVMFSKGEGIYKDLQEAKEWYLKSAKQNYGYAMYNLGVIYEKGYGEEINLTKAKEWYQKAVEQNISKASFNLANIEFRAKNYKKAFNLYKKASKEGNSKAMFHLAWLYQNGKGCEANLSKAKEWYRLSAVKGERDSIKNYSIILESEGKKEEAKFWRRLLKE
jgi:TPR repeat protein